MQAGVSLRGGPQEPFRRAGRASSLRRRPLLLLRHQRRRDARRAGRPPRQSALQPGEPHRPAQERRPRPPRAGEHPERQLGLHGDGVPRLDAQGLDGALASHRATLASPTSPRARPLAPDGISDLREQRHQHPRPSRLHGSPSAYSTAFLSTSAPRPLASRRRNVAPEPRRGHGAPARGENNPSLSKGTPCRRPQKDLRPRSTKRHGTRAPNRRRVHQPHPDKRRVACFRTRAHAKPSLTATAPNQVWTWDITKLATVHKGVFLMAYVIIDLFSRYVVGGCSRPRKVS